jgi:hypothetical protein
VPELPLHRLDAAALADEQRRGRAPQSPGRMTPATARFYEAVVNGQLTHSGDSRLARHISSAVLREDARGAVAAVMAHDRAAALAGVVRDRIFL